MKVCHQTIQIRFHLTIYFYILTAIYKLSKIIKSDINLYVASIIKRTKYIKENNM